jgi:hypothetical protein
VRGAQLTRAEVAPLGADQIPKVFGYDYQTVERSLTDAYTLLTPDFRQEFEDRATKDIIPQARDRQVVSQANVVGVGVLTAQRNSASVLVYMNRTVTDKSRQPVYDGSRLRRLREARRQVADQLYRAYLMSRVEASASRNERAQRSTSCARTCRRNARIRRRPSSGV